MKNGKKTQFLRRLSTRGLKTCIVTVFSAVLLASQCAGSAVSGDGFRIEELADVTFLGAKVEDNIGTHLAGAGDVNGDGVRDMLLSTDMDSCVGCTEFINFAYLIYSATDLPVQIDLATAPRDAVTITDLQTEVSVAGLGDFNGDGYDDVIIGDGLADVNGIPVGGRAFILYGSEVLQATLSIADPGVPGVMIEGGGRSAFFGFVVSAAGDVNGDGFADALVSAPAQYSPETIRESFLIYGGTDVPPLLNSYDLGSYGVRFRSAYPRSALGFDLAAAGDVNRDGLSDFLIGTQVYVEGEAPELAYLVYGSTNLPGLIEVGDLGPLGVELRGPTEHTLFGTNVSGGGDINGDGYDDFLVAAPNGEPSGVYRAGQVYVYFGAPSLPGRINAGSLGEHGMVINGFEREARLGEGLGGPGRIDNDRYADLILSSPQGSEKVSFVYGGPDFAQSDGQSIQELDRTLILDRDGDRLGSAQAFVGDVNGDGIGDILLGARFAEHTKGKAYLIYGGKFDAATPTPTPIEVGDFSGWVLLGTGEVVRTTPLTPTPTATE